MKKILLTLLITLPSFLSAQWVVDPNVQTINFKSFTIGYSDSLEMAVWGFYKLTDKMVAAPKIASRRSPYGSSIDGLSSRSPYSYTGSGYDRGHVVPFAAMDYDKEAAAETFSMFNIVPQTAYVNRGIWKSIEDQVNKLATKLGCVYVNIDNEFLGDVVVTSKGITLPVPRSQTKKVFNCDGELILSFTIKNIH